MKTQSIVKCFVAIGALLVIPSATAAVNVGSSSWVWQNSLPQGNSLKAITCSSTGSSLVCQAVGDLGTILYGDASGGSAISWFGQTSATNQTLRAITCTPGNGNNCFAVGDGGTILATTNDGVNWANQPSGVATGLSGISCQTTTRCFAVGGPWILATSDGGAHWFAQPHPGGAEPTAISCPDSNTCFVTANNSGSNPAILKTTNGGATWPAQNIVDFPYFLTSISCGSTTHCVAVDSGGNSVATADGGNSWGPVVAVVHTAARPFLTGVSCQDALDCVAVGFAEGSGNNLYVTNNGGSTWQGEASGASQASLNGVSCPAGTCVT